MVALCFSFYSLSAQSIKVSEFYLDPSDDEASEYPVLDNDDNLCALVKVVPETVLMDMSFGGWVMESDDVFLELGYYAVYMPANSPKIELKHPDYPMETVAFSDWQVKLKGGKTYKMIISADELVKKDTKTVVFKINDSEGFIEIDGKKIAFEDGIANLELLPDQYDYTITSRYCYPYSDFLSVNDLETEVKRVDLERRTAEIDFSSNVPIARIFIDGTDFGTAGLKSNIPLGKHEVLVTAPDFSDYWKEMDLVLDTTYPLNAKLETKKNLSYIIVNTVPDYADAVLFIDERQYRNWKPGEPIYFENGEHEIRFEKKGYAPKAYRIETEGKESMELSLKMEKAESSSFSIQRGNASYTNPRSYSTGSRTRGSVYSAPGSSRSNSARVTGSSSTSRSSSSSTPQTTSRVSQGRDSGSSSSVLDRVRSSSLTGRSSSGSSSSSTNRQPNRTSRLQGTNGGR